MKRPILACGLFGLYLATGFLYIAISAPDRGRIAMWYTDLEAARHRAEANNKPLLIDFGATWCRPCQTMKRTTLTDDSVVQALRSYVLVAIDVDTHPELAGQLHVDSIPQFFVVDAKNGKIYKEERDGNMLPEDFLAWLNGDSNASVSEIVPGFTREFPPTSR